MSRNNILSAFPKGCQIIHENCSGATLTRHQKYEDETSPLPSRIIIWDFKVIGFTDDTHRIPVACTQTIIAGTSPPENQVVATFPADTHFGFKFRSDIECNFSLYVDGTSEDRYQGTWRHSGNMIWTELIVRSIKSDKGFLLQEATSSDAKNTGILFVKIEPVVYTDSDEYKNQPVHSSHCIMSDYTCPSDEISNDDDVAKCNKRSITRCFNADKTGQKFAEVKPKNLVKNDHIIGNIIMSCF